MRPPQSFILSELERKEIEEVLRSTDGKAPTRGATLAFGELWRVIKPILENPNGRQMVLETIRGISHWRLEGWINGISSGYTLTVKNHIRNPKERVSVRSVDSMLKMIDQTFSQFRHGRLKAIDRNSMSLICTIVAFLYTTLEYFYWGVGRRRQP